MFSTLRKHHTARLFVSLYVLRGAAQHRQYAGRSIPFTKNKVSGLAKMKLLSRREKTCKSVSTPRSLAVGPKHS